MHRTIAKALGAMVEILLFFNDKLIDDAEGKLKLREEYP